MNDRKNWIRLTGEYLSLAFLLPSATFVGYAIGYFLDRAFGTSFLYLVFLLLGIAGGFIQLVRQIQKDSRPRRGL
ncbi:MAG: AtpZ/AtpI family protein [Bryobacteraceae bacterium]|nr:AtpZ/AtpI family protein [Bryobacteraceae bacterium]